jgi:hypothetical protein
MASVASSLISEMMGSIVGIANVFNGIHIDWASIRAIVLVGFFPGSIGWAGTVAMLGKRGTMAWHKLYVGAGLASVVVGGIMHLHKNLRTP